MTDVYVTINAPLGPMDRGDRFADPLTELMDGKVRDFEVTGGGTLMGKNGLSNCDIDLEFKGNADEVLPVIIAALEKLGAPKGSTARVRGKDKTVKFGSTEGIGIYVTVPDPAQGGQLDARALIQQVDAALGDAGEFWTGWQNPTEVALFCYGPSAIRMRELVAPALATLAHRIDAVT